MGARGREAVWHGQQRADGFYGDFGTKKAANNIRAIHTNYQLLLSIIIIIIIIILQFLLT